MAVWDDIRRGAQTVVDESSRLARVARLKAHIKGLEGDLGERVHDLGTRALDLHQRNELHHIELDQIFVQTHNVQRELKDCQDEIETLMASWRPPAAPRTACPDCRSPVRDEDRFCRHCGADLR